MLCGDWKERKLMPGNLIRVSPVIEENNVWLNYAVTLLIAVLFERMEAWGIPTVYKHFWNGQRVWKQEPKYMESPRGKAESFILENYYKEGLNTNAFKSGMFSGIMPICFRTIRQQEQFWQGCLVKEDEEWKSVSLLDVCPGLENPNLNRIYYQIKMAVDKVNVFFAKTFNSSWLDLDKLDLYLAVDGLQKVKVASFDFQLSYHGTPIVLNYDYEDRTAVYPRTVNMKTFAKAQDDFVVKQWEQNSKFMYWHIVNRLLELEENLFTDSMDFFDTVHRYVDAFHMMRTP